MCYIKINIKASMLWYYCALIAVLLTLFYFSTYYSTVLKKIMCYIKINIKASMVLLCSNSCLAHFILLFYYSTVLKKIMCYIPTVAVIKFKQFTTYKKKCSPTRYPFRHIFFTINGCKQFTNFFHVLIHSL